MRKVALIDYSSSSVSLLIAKTEGSVMESILHTRTPLSFAGSVYQDRELTEIEIPELLDITDSFIITCKENGVSNLYAIASANLASVKGIDDILALVTEKTGLGIYKLDMATEAEARIFANERYSILPHSTLIDFGSITTKIYSFSDYITSVPLGPLTLGQDYVSEVIPTRTEAKRIKVAIKEALDEANLPEEGFFENAVLAGVYAWTIYQLYAEYYKLEYNHGEMIIQYKKLKKLSKYLIESEGRSMLILKKAPELMKQVVPAVLLAKELLKRFKINNIVISDLGVKEGILKSIVLGKREQKGIELEG